MRYTPFPAGFPELRGDGLLLRELGEADLPAWFARLADREAAALAGDPVANSMDTVVEGLAHHRAAFRSGTGLRWAIEPEGIGESVGSVGLVAFDAQTRSAEIGAAIGRAHWGRSIATRAGRLVAVYGFEELALETIEALVLPENTRTRRVLEKLGFVRSRDECPAERRIAERADTARFVLRREERGRGASRSAGA